MSARLLPLLLLLAGCPDDTDTDGALRWWTTCGDPACSGYGGPFDGVPLCGSEAHSATCDDQGAECDPRDDCNARLTCAAEDPTDQAGGCPISERKHKKDIHYLTGPELAALDAQIRAMPLSTWRYLGTSGDEAARLGFIIDDVAGSPAVRPDGERVDLYGFTTMAVAGLQVQGRRIEQLEADLASLRAQVEALRVEAPAPR